MYTYVALLRGINVSGQKKIKMAEFREHLVKFGFHSVQTYIQSGNLVFRHPESEHSRVEGIIVAMIIKVYGFEVGVWVRPYNDYLRIVENNPYSPESEEEKAKLYYVFLNQPPATALTHGLESENFANESFKITPDCIFLYCHAGYGKARCDNNFFERRLKVRATTRNLRTMKTLLKMSEELEKQQD